MPWTLGKGYTRNQIQAAFPALEPSGAVARQGNEVAVVLVKTNEPGWRNQFLPGKPRRLRMEANRAHPVHNSALRNQAWAKLLFWSKSGREYVYLGTMKYADLERDPALGLFFVFDLLEPDAPVPGA